MSGIGNYKDAAKALRWIIELLNEMRGRGANIQGERVKLDIKYWARIEEHDDDCGTVCCIMGRAALDKRFRKLGISLKSDDEGSQSERKFAKLAEDVRKADTTEYLSIHYNGDVSFGAVKSFWRILPASAVMYMFDNDYYKNSKSVAEAVRHVTKVLNICEDKSLDDEEKNLKLRKLVG